MLMFKFVGPALGCAFALAACSSDSFTSVVDASADATADASKSDAAVKDAALAAFDDAGLPCPRVTITHPSDNQTRAVDSSVPFSGDARDAKCQPIIDGNLVWTESPGGQIGTGGAFVHTFTTTGTRTITLSATDSASDVYKATITLNVN